MRFRSPKAFMSCLSGVAAVEFALIAPLFFALTIGGVYTGLVVFSAAGLHDAAEKAARCYSVSQAAQPPGQCSTAAQAQTYASNAYYGMSTPTFTASIQACGHNVPLSATACFP
jgi:Flp pilus assembly protein TadG